MIHCFVNIEAKNVIEDDSHIDLIYQFTTSNCILWRKNEQQNKVVLITKVICILLCSTLVSLDQSSLQMMTILSK